MTSQLHYRIFILLLVAGLNQTWAEEKPVGLLSRRVDIHVDGKRPIAGERSRFVVSPRGHVYFTYTLAAGDFSCKPLGHIVPVGEIRMSAIDSESTWNVEGWATYGSPTDLAFDAAGQLHIATRHRGQPYGVDYWRQVDGVWRLESFGADVTYGGNNVSIGLLPDGLPIVVCLDRNRSRLTVWERSDDGKWAATRPMELTNVAAGYFDLQVHRDGIIRVVFCPTSSGPVCATRDVKKEWTTLKIANRPVSRMIASTLDEENRLHVSFAAGARGDSVNELHHAKLLADGTWQTQVVATTSGDHHVGLTDISAAAGRVAIAWEQGNGRKFSPKDYGGSVGSTNLTVISRDGAKTQVLADQHAGRPALALSSNAKTAWVGIYTGNDRGDDFYLLNCQLDGDEPAPTAVVNGKPADIFRDGCLKDIDSGNAKAERRGLQRIDLSGLTAKHRRALIERFLNYQDPLIRVAIVRELTKSADEVGYFADRLEKVLDDPDRLVRKTLLEGLASSKADVRFLNPVLKQAISSDDAMARLSAAEVIRQHPDWISPQDLVVAMKPIHRDLDSDDSTKSGSAAMSLERMIDVHGTRDELRRLSKSGSPLQRVRAALILFRCSDDVELSNLIEVPQCDSEQAQLALCGLLGQVRSAEGVPLLKKLLHSKHAAVRTAAVFALRSVAHIAELKAAAKHPRGFDLLALRAVEATTDDQRRAQRAAIGALATLFEHADPNVRQKTCDALNRVRAKGAMSAISRMHDDPDAGVRIASRTAVGVLSGRQRWACHWAESIRRGRSGLPARSTDVPTSNDDFACTG